MAGRSSTTPTRYQFTGQRNDVEIGLYFYGARYYSSALGRFVSADTLVPGAGNPQAFNRYAYGLNNPVKYTDPSGHAADAGGAGGSCGKECPPPPPIQDELLSYTELVDKYDNVTYDRLSRYVNGAWAGYDHWGPDYASWYKEHAAEWNGDWGVGVDGSPYAPSSSTRGMMAYGLHNDPFLKNDPNLGVLEALAAGVVLPLHRPYLRTGTRAQIEANAQKTADGKFIDPHTNEPIEGEYHYGHVYGRENWRLIEEGENAGMTQAEFNNWVNSNPEWFQIEEPYLNMSHQYEMP